MKVKKKSILLYFKATYWEPHTENLAIFGQLFSLTIKNPKITSFFHLLKKNSPIEKKG
jgi:hypothetical protein